MKRELFLSILCLFFMLTTTIVCVISRNRVNTAHYNGYYEGQTQLLNTISSPDYDPRKHPEISGDDLVKRILHLRDSVKMSRIGKHIKRDSSLIKHEI